MSLGGLIGGVVGGVVGFFIGGPMGAVYGASIGFAGGMMIDPMTPDMPTVGAPDIQQTVMNSDIGVPVKDLSGTAKIVGHLLVYGAERTEPIYQEAESGGGGKGGPPEPEPQVIGHKHYMTWAVGFVAGKVTSIYTIFKNDDVVWEGELDCPVSGGQETITLEGMGTCTFYFGTADQTANASVGAILDDATLNSPLRHLCWCVFEDCYIGDYPRCPTMKVVARKIHDFTFQEDTAAIQIYDSNPMHTIWYILNQLSELPESWLDETDFAAVAIVLYLESRGISVLFDTQQQAIDYISAINNHIENILRYGSDGKFHPKLIRPDYDIDTLPVVDENILLDDPTISRRSWIDTLNEVKVQYTELIATRPIEPFTEQGGYAPGVYIAYSPSVGGVLGRYVVTGQNNVNFYSDDGGVSWTSYAPLEHTGTVRWISELSAFICCFSNAIGKSWDGINWVKSNECDVNDYLGYSEIVWSTRTTRLWVVSQQGGSTSKVHTSLDGLTLNVNIKGLGLYQQAPGGCTHGQKDYFFSANYAVALQCITPDTIMDTWSYSAQLPWGVEGYPRGRLLSNGSDMMAYSGCYNHSEGGWTANVGPEGAKYAWNIGQYGYGKFCVMNINVAGIVDGFYRMRYSTDGITYYDSGGDFELAMNWYDCAVGNDRVVTIGQAGTGRCKITKFSE